MLRQLKLRHRIGLLVAVAAAGLIAVTTVTLVLGWRGQRELSGIETRYVPLIELNRDLKTTFVQITHALEDAANAAEDGPIRDADVLQRDLVERLHAGQSAVAANGGDPAALDRQFRTYYAAAREVSAAIVAGTPADQLTDKIARMQRERWTFTARLDVETQPDRRQITAAFAAARDSQRDTLVLECIVAIGVFAAMALLSWRIIHRTVTSLHKVAMGVKRLAQGELSDEIDVAGNDEIGELAREANRTAMRLREYREHTQRLLQETHRQADDLRQAHDIVEARNATLLSTQQELEHRAAELERMSAILRNRNADLENVSQTLSHDLRAPLRSICGFSQILAASLEGKLDEDSADALERVVRGGARMTRMLDDLYRLLRLSADEATRVAVDTAAVLHDVTENLRTDLEQTGATITHDELPTITGNAMLFGQVLQNLIANSLKFHGDAKPAIHIGVQSRDDSYQFSVRDNGVGIEPSSRERVFRLFERSTTESGGTGVGLALCKRAAEKLGGQIWVDPSVSSGTTIVFTVPRAHKPAP